VEGLTVVGCIGGDGAGEGREGSERNNELHLG
jgi:hypothetical protein